MPELTEKSNTSTNSSFWHPLWFAIVFSVCSSIFREFLSAPISWILASIPATCISYLATPKLKIGFFRFFALIQAVVLMALAAVWFLPLKLRETIPDFWAYAFPLLLMFNVIYFLPNPFGRERGSWWKWATWTLVVTVLFSWLMSSLER